MPIDYRWLLPQQVLLVDLIGAITIEEFLQLRNDMTTIAEHPPVHSIVRFERVTSAPSLREFGQFRGKGSKAWVVFVHPNPNAIVTTLISVIMKVGKMRFRIVRTVPEAMVILQRADAQLQAARLPHDFEAAPLLHRIDAAVSKRKIR